MWAVPTSFFICLFLYELFFFDQLSHVQYMQSGKVKKSISHSTEN